MKKKRLAVIGASYLQLPLVLKALSENLEVYCFAWRDKAVCKDYATRFYPISVTEKDEILSVCRELQIDGICTIASDVAVTTVDHVASRLGLISDDESVAVLATNKYQMRHCFQENNIPSPVFFRKVERFTDLPLKHLKYPLIVKPTDRSGSLGVQLVDSADKMEDAVERAKAFSFEKKAIVESYIEGREISVESISWDGKHYILQITDKVTTGFPYFVELEHHQPTTLDDDIQKRVKDIVTDALSALGHRFGAAHSELKITDDGQIYVIEIGARMGGDFIGSDLVELSTGYDYLKGVIDVALGQFTPPTEVSTRNFSGVYFLCKEREYVKPYIDHKEDFPEIVSAGYTGVEMKNVKCSGDRSGYFIYRSDRKFCCNDKKNLR
jgi:biotin carboxylase